MHILHMGRSWLSPPTPTALPPPTTPPPPVRLWNWELRHRLISFRLSTKPLGALAVPFSWPDPGLAQLEGLPCPVTIFSVPSFLPSLSSPCPPTVSVSTMWWVSVSSSLVSEQGVKVATGAITVMGEDMSVDGDDIREFKLRLRLGLGSPSPCSFLPSSSSSSSSSLTSSWIWFRTGALIRDARRLPEDADEEEALLRSTTWEGSAEGDEYLSSSLSSSSSSSTLKRLGLRGLLGPPEVREPSLLGLEWGFDRGLSPLSGFCRAGSCWLNAAVRMSCRWLRSSRAVLGLGPLWRLSALRAGDCGPPGWEIDGPPKPSLTSWWTSTLVGQDCLSGIKHRKHN